MAEPYTWGSDAVPGWCEMFMYAVLREQGMPETKTFKHPRIVYTWINDEIVGWSIHQFPTEFFSSDEWDMEVTFTKKVKPVEAGQWRELGKPGEEVSVYVLALYGTVAWLTDDPEALEHGHCGAWTEPLDKLR